MRKNNFQPENVMINKLFFIYFQILIFVYLIASSVPFEITLHTTL